MNPASDSPFCRRVLLRQLSCPHVRFRWLPALIASTFILTSASFAAIVVAPSVSHIITLRAGVDVDGLIQEFNLHPAFIYRHALHGFAAALDSAASEQLKQDPRVLTGGSGQGRQYCHVESGQRSRCARPRIQASAELCLWRMAALIPPS